MVLQPTYIYLIVGKYNLNVSCKMCLLKRHAVFRMLQCYWLYTIQ